MTQSRLMSTGPSSPLRDFASSSSIYFTFFKINSNDNTHFISLQEIHCSTIKFTHMRTSDGIYYKHRVGLNYFGLGFGLNRVSN